MTSLCTSDADLTGIGPGLKVDRVVHQAVVRVDEEGTEAAAATAVVIRASSAMPTEDPVDFVADRPFLFALRDSGTGAVLFVGRVLDPTGPGAPVQDPPCESGAAVLGSVLAVLWWVAVLWQ